ncbi:alpha/beta hydrolase [Caulobacter sp. KR2-114]|uniref:alpha/beta hydrolase n=1 Tax=Caulobacter sp. KR2-114 TaxID=3400912 RepID=UPI003C009A86
MRFALVHSPLVGPGCWRPTAAALEARGHQARAVDPGPVQPDEDYQQLADRIAARALEAGPPDVLVGHSGAGGLLAGVAATLKPQATLFVDAILPHPGRSWFDTAPPALVKRLRGLAQDGRLPPWNRWFSIGAPENSLAEPAVKAAFLAELPSPPLSYLQAPAPAWPFPPAVSTAYVQLSGGYVREALAARDGAWTVVRADLHHLAMLTDPDKVADLMLEALARLEAEA